MASDGDMLMYARDTVMRPGTGEMNAVSIDVADMT